MPKRTWTVNTEDGSHTVTLEHGALSGKRIIKVDGNIVHKSAALIDLGGDYPFQFGRHSAFVSIWIASFWPKYDLVLDGISLKSGKKVVQRGSIPLWAWPFMLACVAVPLLTVGGAIPSLIGAGGAYICLEASRGSDDKSLTRAAICVGITLATWLVVVAFVFIASALLR